MVDGGAAKTWSSMQATVAQSSGEAEYYAMIRAAAEALGLQSIMRDMGWETTIRLWVDSSAAKSMASRTGLGKVRHMEVKYLWLQEAVKNRRIVVKKILGTSNPADVLTKPKPAHEAADLLRRVGVHVERRRPAPPLLQRQATMGPNRDSRVSGGRETKPMVCQLRQIRPDDARDDYYATVRPNRDPRAREGRETKLTVCQLMPDETPGEEEPRRMPDRKPDEKPEQKEPGETPKKIDDITPPRGRTETLEWKRVGSRNPWLALRRLRDDTDEQRERECR